MWSVTNYFLLNLAVADILMATFNCIFSFIYMRDRQTWRPCLTMWIVKRRRLLAHTPWLERTPKQHFYWKWKEFKSLHYLHKNLHPHKRLLTTSLSSVSTPNIDIVKHGWNVWAGSGITAPSTAPWTSSSPCARCLAPCSPCSPSPLTGGGPSCRPYTPGRISPTQFGFIISKESTHLSSLSFQIVSFELWRLNWPSAKLR